MPLSPMLLVLRSSDVRVQELEFKASRTVFRPSGPSERPLRPRCLRDGHMPEPMTAATVAGSARVYAMSSRAIFDLKGAD